jgi:NADPH2 dehydrogenase
MTDSHLFQPITIGDLRLQHRIVHSPLTRLRVTDQHVINHLVPEYYAQRASEPGTLLITEATLIAAEAGGMNNVPGIWSDEQISQWKNVGGGFGVYIGVRH